MDIHVVRRRNEDDKCPRKTFRLQYQSSPIHWYTFDHLPRLDVIQVALHELLVCVVARRYACMVSQESPASCLIDHRTKLKSSSADHAVVVLERVATPNSCFSMYLRLPCTSQSSFFFSGSTPISSRISPTACKMIP